MTNPNKSFQNWFSYSRNCILVNGTVPFCLPSLTVQWPTRTLHFSLLRMIAKLAYGESINIRQFSLSSSTMCKRFLGDKFLPMRKHGENTWWRKMLMQTTNIEWQCGKWFEPKAISYLFGVIVQAKVVFRKTVVGDWRFNYLSGSHLQSQVKSRRQIMVFMSQVSFVVMWLVVKMWKL